MFSNLANENNYTLTFLIDSNIYGSRCDFNIPLNPPIEIDTQYWEVALSEIAFDLNTVENIPSFAYVFSDLIQHQYFNDTKLSILRIVPLAAVLKNKNIDKQLIKLEFNYPNYLQTNKSYIDSVHIYIGDKNSAALVNFNPQTVSGVLKLRRKKNIFPNL
jgi:hypothetical protein